MPVAILDLVVIGIVLLSGLLAMVRGFTREVLAIGSWAVAALVAYFGWPKAAPLVMQYVVKQPPMLVNGIALGAVFLATLLVAYIITSKLSDFILDSRVGALDRTLGFLFGAARGFLLAVIGFGLFSLLVNDRQLPDWVNDAKLRPVLVSSFEKLKGMLPDNLDERIGSIKQITDELKAGTPGAPPPKQ
ncbi:MAG: CvpA family protein [Proteobacteria bacterium]|nr:CvpA family protein [Pseudomonadota bacterium]